MAVRHDGEEEGGVLDPEDPPGEEAQNLEEEIDVVEAPVVEDAEEEENIVDPGIMAEQEENPGEQAAQLAELATQMNDRRTELMAIAEQAQLEHQAMEAEAERLHTELVRAKEAFENAVGEEATRNAEIEKNRLENNFVQQKNLIQQNLVNVQMAAAVAAPPQGTLQLGEEWFEDLDASSLDCFGCLFELMDNSIFHAEEHVPMNIEINVHMKENQQEGDLVEKIEIIDNGCGIDSTIIFAALSPWGRKGLNDEDNPSEHGMGMKYGISGLGKNFTLETKTRRDTHSKIVTQETCKLMVRHIAQNLGPVVLEENIVTWDHGTRITITNCNEKGHELGFKVSAADTLRDAALEISNRYRRFIPNKLHPDNFSIKRIDHQGNVIYDYSLISGYKPIYYFNPFQDELKLPIIDRFPLEPEDGSNRWYATLTFGVAPSEIEWNTHFTEEEQQKRNRQYDLYKVKTSGGGFDVVYKDLVLQREYLTKDKLGGLPGIIKNHPSNNRLRGIID
ncbi:MAG: ATP-binding protein, partial [Candidatus Poseidoniaceae archaeon]